MYTHTYLTIVVPTLVIHWSFKKYLSLSLTPRNSDLIGLGWGPHTRTFFKALRWPWCASELRNIGQRLMSSRWYRTVFSYILLDGSIDLHAFFFLIESYRMWTTCRTFNVWLVNKNYFNVCLVPFYFYEVICYCLYLCELLWHCCMVSLRYLNPVLYFSYDLFRFSQISKERLL